MEKFLPNGRQLRQLYDDILSLATFCTEAAATLLAWGNFVYRLYLLQFHCVDHAFPPEESVGCDVGISSIVQPLSPQNAEENPPQNAPDNVNIVTGGAFNAAGGESATFSSNPTSQLKKKFKLHGNACKSFRQAFGVAIVGNAQVMTDRAVILVSIILSPNVYENSEIVTGRITRGIIPEALKSHVQMLPPRELEELIDIARAFPKAKTKSKILAEGFIGSKASSVDPAAAKKKEATAKLLKLDIELVDN